MTKYVLVKDNTLPENLSKEEYVIDAPSFINEIRECERKRPKNNLITPNYLREIATLVGNKYDENFNAVTSIKPTLFKGRSFNNDDEVNSIVIEMFYKQYPVIFDKYVDYHIKQREFGTKLIYFKGDHLLTGSFSANGIDSAQFKDIEQILGKKKNTKKVTKKDSE